MENHSKCCRKDRETRTLRFCSLASILLIWVGPLASKQCGFELSLLATRAVIVVNEDHMAIFQR